MSSNEIVVSENEIQGLEKRINEMNTVAMSFHGIRQKQILRELSNAGKARTRMLRRLERWMNLLETKLFDPAIMAQIDIPKLISLMKFVSTLNLRTVSSMSKLDDVMGKYFEIMYKNNIKDQDIKEVKEEIQGLNEVKKDIFDSLKKALIVGLGEATDAAVIPVNPEQPQTIASEETKAKEIIQQELDKRTLAEIKEELKTKLEPEEKKSD